MVFDRVFVVFGLHFIFKINLQTNNKNGRKWEEEMSEFENKLRNSADKTMICVAYQFSAYYFIKNVFCSNSR